MSSSTSITVSHSGVERRVRLCAQPGIELSDERVASLESDLHNQLRNIFQLSPSTKFYLHEAESSRVMSRESFREYTEGFPSHWYLVSTRGSQQSSQDLVAEAAQDDFLAGLATPPATPPSDDVSSECPLSEEEDDDVCLSLTDLTALPEQSYSTSVVACDVEGNFGLSLRHFTIQSDSSQRTETPMEDYDRPLSRISIESSELKLSTTFVHHVIPGGVASQSGLEHGQVVHMINGASIIRSSVEDIRKLVVNCGHQMTLLTLPKEHDDLQFLYPRYTYGPTGEYSTKDGLVNAVDIEAVRGIPPDHVTSPPTGMMAFDDVDYASQDNSQSCDQQLSRKHSDVLIEGSLLDIENSAPPPIPPRSYRKPTKEAPPTAWYSDTFSLGQEVSPASEEIIVEGPNSRPPPLPVRVRTRSNSPVDAKVFVPSSQETSSPSNVGTPLTSSMTALDSLGSSNHGRSRSTDLGKFKIKKKGKESLEGLTRIASDGTSKRLSIKPKRELPSPDPPKHDQMSYSGRSASTTSLGKKSGRHGYQHKRRELHSRSSKSKVGVASAETPPPKAPPPLRRPHTYSEVDIMTSSTPEASQGSQGEFPLAPPSVLVRNSSKSSADSPNRPQRQNRPLSAIEHASLGPKPPNIMGPFSLAPPTKTPIYKTRSIGDQSFREVNIEEAIAASQGPVDHTPYRGAGRSLSIDAGTVMDTGSKRKSRKRGKDLLDGSPETGKSLGMSPTLRKLSGEVLSTMGIPNRDTQTNIQMHGVLTKKQDLLASGKRVSDRSWRSYYAVLASNTISFYRDRKEAGLRVPTEEPSILVLPSKTSVAKNSKKKFVFRVVTQDGAVFLLQASDASALKRWVGTIQDLNGGPPSPEAGTLNRSYEGTLAPPSPGPGRRSFSPLHKSGKKKDDSNKKFNLKKRLRDRLNKNKDEPDYSSYVTFGVPLEDCPVSMDNKRVPLVVEYCVRMVEAHGLDVEGIYRKPGTVSFIKQLSNEMDKGIYESTMDDLGDVHIVGSLLKKFFKDLPDSLIPEAAHSSFIQCARVPDEEARLGRLADLVLELPVAHYHTLSFLMEHLKKITSHSETNLMTFRNVALVFGPTLVRGDQDFLSTMNESYTIVELLCRHVEQMFQGGQCAEELRAEEPVGEVSEPSRGSPLVRDAPTGSPPSRRQGPTTNGHGWDRNRSIDSGVSSPGDQRSPDQGKSRRKQRHLYEEVEKQRHTVRHNYEDVDVLPESRTSNWVSKHSESGWGQAEEGARGVGSMWATQNRSTRRSSTSKRTDSFERDLSSSYHTPSRSYSQRSRAVSTLPSNTTLPSNPTSPTKRKSSYVIAMGRSENRFSASEFIPESRFPSVGSASDYQSLHRQPRQHTEALLRQAPGKTAAIQRTRSHGGSNRREGITRTPSGHQLEGNYTIKQSLL